MAMAMRQNVANDAHVKRGQNKCGSGNYMPTDDDNSSDDGDGDGAGDVDDDDYMQIQPNLTLFAITSLCTP